jgi:exopolysaccharide production protein ExoQ
MSYIALSICACFILWLFCRDRKLRPVTSWGLWPALLWLMLIGSKSTAYWLGAEVQGDASAEKYIEGSPLDRGIYLTLIVLGWLILRKRKIDWGTLFRSNRWLIALFVYYGVSIAWSDFPFVSFKRWVKDIGNIMMVLLMVTESDPIQAMRAVVSRYIYFAIPGSLLLIHFFPTIGLSVNPQTGDILYIGVTTDKNELGVVLTICGLFLSWDFIFLLLHDRKQKLDILLRGALLVMVLWLIIIARSATGLICLTLGVTTLIVLRVGAVRSQIRYLGTYTFVTVFTIAALFFFTDVTELIVKLVEKDMTFTGRTDIWAGLLSEPINPLVGTGYSSFWLKPSMMGSFHGIIQAHNGYLETYLNGGIIAVCLLMVVIIATGAKVKNEILKGSEFAVLLFSVFVITLFYNLTETMFNRLDLIWFMFLVASITYPKEEAFAEAHYDGGSLVRRREQLLEWEKSKSVFVPRDQRHP